MLFRLPVVKDRIETVLSKQFKAEVLIRKINFSFFPRPQFQLYDVRLTMGEALKIDIPTLMVDPQLSPLIRGEIKIKALRLQKPTIRTVIPDISEDPNGSVSSSKFDLWTSASRFSWFFSVLAFIETAPDSSVQMQNGEFIGHFKGQALSVTSYEMSAFTKSGVIFFEIRARSNVWDRIVVNGHFDPKKFLGEGEITVTGYRAKGLGEFLFPGSPVRLSGSDLGLDLTWHISGAKHLRGRLSASLPDVVIHTGEKQLLFQPETLAAQFELDQKVGTLTVESLKMEAPKATLSGKLRMDFGGTEPRLRMSVSGRDLSIGPIRRRLLSLDDPPVVIRNVFHVLRDGDIPQLTAETSGNTLKEMADSDRLRIRGTLKNGKLFIPTVDLNLTDVSGQTEISGNVLTGRSLAARFVNTTGSDGTLILGLSKGNDQFRLDLKLFADLSQVPPVLERVIDHPKFLGEMKRVEKIDGRARGHLTLGDTLSDIRTRIEVSEFDLTTRLRDIPHSLQLKGGEVIVDGSRVSFNHIDGRLEQSTSSGISGFLDWRQKPSIEIASKSSLLIPQELYPRFGSNEKRPDELKNLVFTGGSIRLGVARLSGPLEMPFLWSYDVVGDVVDLSAKTPFFTTPVMIPQGKFHVTEKRLTVENTRIRVLDADVEISGVLHEYRKGIDHIEMTFHGQVDGQAIQWAMHRFSLPADFQIQTPVSISRASLSWNPEKEITFSGAWRHAVGPSVELNLSGSPKMIAIQKLTIADEESQASATFELRQNALNFSFDGALSSNTLRAMFIRHQGVEGYIDGRFQVHLFPDEPTRSTARGTLKGKHILFPLTLRYPLELQRFSLEASGKQLTIHSMTAGWGKYRLDGQGTLDLTPAGVNLDIDTVMDELTWPSVSKDPAPTSAVPAAASPENVFARINRMPLTGEIRVSLGAFHWKDYTWKDVLTALRFEDGGVTVHINRADLCGVDTPGTIHIRSGGIFSEFHPETANASVEILLDCLLQEPGVMSGSYALNGVFRGDDLALSAMSGKLTIQSEKGVIYRFGILASVISFINVTEIFAGDLPEMSNQGFPYHTVRFEGRLTNGKLAIEELTIDAQSMTVTCQGDIDLLNELLDLTVLVAPFKTVDRLVKALPVVRTILGGSLVSLPVRVKGAFTAPRVTPLAPSAVGEGMLNVMKRTLKLPLVLFEIHPSKKPLPEFPDHEK